MEQISLAYGTEQIQLDLTGASQVTYLTATPAPPLADLKACLLEGLCQKTVHSPPLHQLISSTDQVTIVISDLTRFWMRQDLVCQPLVEYLHQDLGLAYEQMTIVVALGTHRFHTAEEHRKLVGTYVYERVQVVDHDCDSPDVVYMGKTSRGTEVWVNPLLVGRKVITISGTVHHLMAGYGGGRKSILPGLASRKTIGLNHRLALDPVKAMSDVRIGSAKLLENPINEDMNEAADLVDVTFGINIVMNSQGQQSALFCGQFVKAWQASCAYVQASYGYPIDYEADVVIASCGGFPKDINLYQSVKSLFNAVNAVKPGGTLILLTECPEGGGAKDFFDWLEPLKAGRLDEALRENFTIGGYIFYAACENACKGTTYLLSSIQPELVKEMGLKAYSSIKELMKQVDLVDKRVYIIPNGGSLLPQLKEEYEKYCQEAEDCLAQS